MAIDVSHSPTVEATSLAPLLALADNPPIQPRSTQPRARPLVLYIARVPGSRDVFLTPVKPRQKVVSASDVLSSLYYIHVHSSEAAENTSPMLKETRADSPMADPPALPERPNRKDLPPPLPRRAVPASTPPYPMYDTDTSPPVPPVPTSNISRKPVLPQRSLSRSLESGLPVLPPRALPPTPPLDEQGDFSQVSLHTDNIRLLHEESHVDPAANPFTYDYSQQNLPLSRIELEQAPESGTFTLIRRHPGTNEQWNVATISDPPVLEVSSTSTLIPTAKRRTKKGGAPLYLDITNPGYGQFVPPLSPSASRPSISTTSSTEESEPSTDGVFRRRVYMPGSRFGEHGYAKSWHRKTPSASSVHSANSEAVLPLPLREQRHSVDLGSMGVADRRAGCYTFLSPWNGRCEFVSGASGRTLKCRHQSPATADGHRRTADLSELRFNLPSSTKSTFTSSLPRTSYFTSRSHLFDTLAEDGIESPTFVLNDDGTLDLSLGQEKAGGGFGGKQAKLGKLIIEPAGFEMLDLLVASNMGLWFRAWEKV